MNNQMSTPTPTPKTDAELIKDAEDSWAHRDTLWAEKLHRQLSDMQARIDQLESERDNWRVSSVAREAVARAEAAEAALIELKSPSVWAMRLIDEHWKDDGRDACNLDGWCALKDALAKSPAETRSVIAGLREEVAKLKESRDYWEGQSELERAQRQKEIGMQEYRGNTISYIYDKERNYGAHFDRMRGEIAALKAQLAALISAGNAVVARLHERMAVFGCNVSDDTKAVAWEAAVSGAHAGAKGNP